MRRRHCMSVQRRARGVRKRACGGVVGWEGGEGEVEMVAGVCTVRHGEVESSGREQRRARACGKVVEFLPVGPLRRACERRQQRQQEQEA